MNSAARSLSAGMARLVAGATIALAVITPGCGGPQQEVGSISISKSKEAAARNGIAGPGGRDGVGPGAAADPVAVGGGRGGRGTGE